MRAHFLILSSLVLTLQSFAQTTKLYGLITDPNQRPIDFVTIQLTSSESTTSTLSDEDGKFKFLGISSDSIKIIVKTLGYYEVDTSLYINKADSNWIKFTLSPSTLIVCTEATWIGFGSKRAEEDISNKYYRILLPSGLVLEKLPGDEGFEKKYNVTFYNQCQYIKKESLSAYNQVVFKYLDKTYGKKWRKEVRQDLPGLKK